MSARAAMETPAAPDAPVDDRRETSELSGVPSRRLPVGLAIVVAATVTAFVHLRTAFFFSNDDMPQLNLAHEAGLSWELLSLNVFGHFGPVNRLGHLAFLRLGGLDLTAGAVGVSALVLLLLLTLLWVCHELRLSTVRTVFVVGGVGFSSILLDTAVWLDAALHILPALIATYSVVAAHLRALNTGARRWHVVSVVLFALGLTAQERPAFALPLILLADLLLVTAGRPWRRRLDVLRGAWVPLAAMAVIGGVAAVLLQAFYGSPDARMAAPTVLAQTIAAAFTGALFPALVGWMPLAMPSATVQFVSGLLILAVAGLVVLRRRSNGGPLLFALLAFLLYYGFLAFSPILIPETIAVNAFRIHNVVYVVIPVLIGLASLRLSPEPRARFRGRPEPEPAGRSRFAAAAVAAFLVLLVVVADVYTHQRWSRVYAGHAYEANVAAAKPEWTRPGSTVLPLLSPEPVAGGWSAEFGRHEALLPLYEPGWTPGPLADRTVVLDAEARVRSVVVREETRAALPVEGSNAPGCLESSPGFDRLTFPLDEPVGDAPLFAAVTYEVELNGLESAQLTGITFDEQREWRLTTWPVPLVSGQHTVFVPLGFERPVASVALGDVTHGVSLCVTELSVVRPVYEVDGGCRAMDVYGAMTSRTDCPVGGDLQ